MDNTQLARAGPSVAGGAVTRFSKRIARKPSLSTNNENNENNIKKVVKGRKDQENAEVMPTKGMKRSTSATNVATRKRTAFGDITNAIQSHANRMAQARSKKDGGAEKSFSKPAPAKPAINKRASNRLKTSKSTSALPIIPIYVDEEPGKTTKTDDVEMQVPETVPECSGAALPLPRLPSGVPALTDSPLPAGVEPFDLSTDADHVCEYAHSIFRNMRKREAKYPVSAYFMREGRMSTGSMRAILVDWLVEVQENFQLYHETLYVAVKLLDMYLEHNDTPKERLQLVGATALLIACKVEEQQPPPLDDFQYICDDAYTNKLFLDMEMKIMKALNYDINIPVAYRYLRRFSRVTQMGMEILTLARFVLELSLQDPRFVHQPASKMAASCLCLAMKMKHVGEWSINHSYHAGYEEKELVDVMRDLNTMVIASKDSKLKNVRTKYSHPVHFAVANTTPLPLDAFDER